MPVVLTIPAVPTATEIGVTVTLPVEFASDIVGKLVLVELPIVNTPAVAFE